MSAIDIVHDVVRHAAMIACHGAKEASGYNTVGFHNLNLRIFNLRVSNPNKLICGSEQIIQIRLNKDM